MDNIWKLVKERDFATIIRIIRTSKVRIKITEFDNLGRTLLHHAAIRGNFELVLTLATLPDFEIDIKCKFNRTTPLQYSCRDGRLEICKFLIEKGADYNHQDKDGYTCLHFACLNRHERIIEYLVAQKDINPNLQDSSKRTPLHRCVESGDMRCVRILMKLELELNVQDHHGQIPLHYASYGGMNDICLLLCRSGSDTSIIDKDGRKPLDWGMGFDLHDLDHPDHDHGHGHGHDHGDDDDGHGHVKKGHVHSHSHGHGKKE